METSGPDKNFRPAFPTQRAMHTTILAAAAGALVGCVTGLTPGIHPNTVVFVALPLLIEHPPALVFPFITATAVVHSVLNFIPSILVGVPDADSALASLPGKNMLLRGKAYTAIHTTLTGGFLSTIFSLLLLPLIFFIIPAVYDSIEPFLPFVITLFFCFMVVDSENIPHAVICSILSGSLGILALNIDSVNSTMALFPLLTGLFGLSVVIRSLDTGGFPTQLMEPYSIDRKDVEGGVIGALSGFLAGILPGLGPSGTISLFSSQLSERRQFLSALGGINTADTIFSLLALYLIEKPRSGAAIAIQKIGTIDSSTFFLLLGVAIAASILGYLFGSIITEPLLLWYNSVNQSLLLRIVTVFVIVAVAATAGFAGLGILLAATAVGLYTDTKQVRKGICMACLIAPVLLYSFGATG